MTRLLLLSLLILVPRVGLAEGSVEEPFVLVKGKPAPSVAPKAPERGLLLPQTMIDATLNWLVRQQHRDGRWVCVKGKPSDDRDVIPTSLALLAYYGESHFGGVSMYAPTVRAARTWLLDLGSKGKGCWGAKSEAPVLTQAIAAWTLAEIAKFTKTPQAASLLDPALAKLAAMERPGGGFGFTPKGPPNALATAVVVLALKAYKLSNIDPPDGLMARCRAFLKRCTAANGLTGFSKPGQGISLRLTSTKKTAPAPARVPLFSAAAQIGGILCGVRRSEDRMRRGVKLLSVPHPDRPEPLYWYLGSYTAFHWGGKVWKRWAPALRVTLAKGHTANGSWKPAGVLERLGGAIGTTALNALTLRFFRRMEQWTRD